MEDISCLNPNTKSQALEVWGGAECTVNRVGDRYFDQMEISGHAGRLGDYERFAELGIKTYRFGLLWERHELDPSWRWADERLHWMRRAGVRPIAGLLHHGSGPPHTNLLDPEFPNKLAAYAGAVAERYPWIDAYTPVNESNTTARFSGMYGVWYPHHKSRQSYLRALMNQTKAIVLSMEAIRRVRSDARLIQTEDLGCIRGTEQLRPMWELMNERRWLSFDLLYGKVDRYHPLFDYLVASSIPVSDILWFRDHPCPPNVIGANYYVTSDRYLDHRTDLYPQDRRSAEGDFVDVEAVRVEPLELCGIESLALDAWQRYETPVAVTEIQLNGTAAEQIRWASEAWTALESARRQGAQCIALTFWAMLGSFYWDCLVTRDNGHYESGVFDVRGGSPARTELAELVVQMANGRGVPGHVMSGSGWWRDPTRFCFPFDESLDEIAA